MKYVFLIPELKRGGPINVVKNLVETDFFMKLDVYIIAIRSQKDFIYEQEFLKNTKIIYLENGNILSKLNQLKEVLYNISPNVVHSNGFYPDIFLSFLLGNRYKKVTTIHNVIYQDYYSRYGIKGYLFSFIHYLVLKFTNFYKIFGCSREVANSLDKIIRSKKIDYVNNGVNIDKFSCKSEISKNIIKDQLGLDSEIIITFCGGVERVKRVPDLVNDYIANLTEFDFKFIIIGDGPELNQIKEDSRIIKIGRVNDPSLYLKASDVVVSNSSSEGYPMAILEALASGCKVFLSDIPSHNYIIKKYKNCAFKISDLNKDFIYKVLENKLSENEIYSISSSKMALDYLEKI